MRFVETAERCVRYLGRDTVPVPTKRQLWFQYMTVKRVLETRSFDMPATVQIEINTDCNRACWYCSNSLFPKKPEQMEEGLFKGIIDELAAIKFRGRIVPHQSSEPLLHPRLTDLMVYARKAEKAVLVIYTNGDFLDREKFDQLKKAGVDLFVITQHGRHAPQSLRDLITSLNTDEQKGIIYQTLDGAKLFNRSIPGLIPAERRAVADPCFHADYHLQVLVNGDVAQCCMGFAGEHIFGNVKEMPLLDIWRSPDFKSFRKEVSRRQYRLEVCKRCVYDIKDSYVRT